MDRLDLLDRVRGLLERAGFFVSERVDVRPVSFDVAARRDAHLLFVKVLQNIDAFGENVAVELKTLAQVLKGAALLVGERSGAGDLSDGVVYVRHGVPIVTPATLEEQLGSGEPPLAYAAPGGFYVNLDGGVLRQLREQRNLALGTLARIAGVSRRTIAMYEEGMGATVEAAMRLEEFLETSIIRPVDPLAVRTKQAGEATPRPTSPLEREVFRLLEAMGYDVTPTGASPLDALSREGETSLLTGISDTDARLVRKARIMASVSRVTEYPGVFIVKRTITHMNIEGAPLISREELKKLREPESVLELLREREKERKKPAP